MRTLLAGEETQAKSDQSDYYVKLEVQNASGTWKDVGALLGSHWIVNARWGEHRDSPVSGATFTLVQKIGANSLAPLMSSSVLNVDDLGAYAPLLHIGRLVRWSTATMAHGVALDVAKYRLVGSGRIDDVDENEDADGHSTITILCSDSGAWLMSHQIETEGTEYGDPVTPPTLESVLQAVITANTPVGEPAVTLVKESSSSFGVTAWNQGATKLMEALVTLVSDSVGEDIRYRFDASHNYNLTWFDPDRDRVTVDSTFGPEQYVVHDFKKSFADIRNDGELAYVDKTTGLPDVVTQHDSVSKAQYRKQFFRLPSSKLLQSATEAQAVIDAAVNDLSQPPAEAAIELPYCWFVQLYDRYTFQANNRQYDSDQTFAIGGYEHSIENARGSTTLTATARIVGAYAWWLKRIAAANPDPLAPSLSTSCDSSGQIIQNSIGDIVTVSQKILSRNDRLPTEAEVRATVAIAGQSIAGRASGVTVVPGANAYTAAFAYNGSGAASPLATCVVPREGSGAAADPTCSIDIGDSKGARSVPVTLSISFGAGGSTSYVYDLYRQSANNTVPVLEASGSNSVNPLSPRTVNVLKAMRNPTGLKLIVTDSVTGLSGEANDVLPPMIGGPEAAGSGSAYSTEGDTRSGAGGGYSVPGQSYSSDPVYNHPGTHSLIDPDLERFTSDISGPTGIGATTIERGGNKGDNAIDSSYILLAASADMSRPYTNKHLGNIPDDASSDRRAATLDQKTGGDRAKAAIDSGNVVVTTGLDISRAYTGKHLGNVPDDATSDRRAATLDQKTGGDRGKAALDSSNNLVTGVTAAAKAADGVAGIESTKGANAKSARTAGAGKGYGDEDDTRVGRGGVATKGNEFTTLPLFLDDGSAAMIDPVTGELTTHIIPATGFKVKPDLAVKNSGGTTAFGVNRHNDEQTARDGDSKSFGVSFDNVPQIRAIPQALKTFIAASSASDQRLDVRATGVTVAGFTARAKIITGRASTARTDYWAATLNGTPNMSGIAMSASGDAAYCDITHASAYITSYIAKFDVDTTSMDVANTVYVSLYKNAGTSSTSWTLIGSASYGAGLTLTGETISFDDMIALDYDLRLVVTYAAPAGILVRATVTAKEVDYAEITGSTEANATNDSSDGVVYQAMEAP